MLDRRDLITLLRSHGAKEERMAKHGMIWRLPNGKTVLVCRPTRLDPHAMKNLHATIRRAIGCQPQPQP